MSIQTVEYAVNTSWMELSNDDALLRDYMCAQAAGIDAPKNMLTTFIADWILKDKNL